jgi:sec-independent protein translocase protein TatB
MFDIGFSELVLIFIVGLLVLGPEKLPGVIRTTSLWLARLRRSFNDVRAEIEREVGYDEIKRELHNQTILDSLKEVRDDLKQTGRDLSHLPYDVSDVIKGQQQPAQDDPAAIERDPNPPADADQRNDLPR